MSYVSHCYTHGYQHRVTVKCRYEQLGPHMRAAEKAPEIIHDAVVEDGVLVAENDMMIKTALTDIVIKGSMYTPAGQSLPEMEAAVAFNGHMKRIKVTGQRYLESTAPLKFSQPEPFEKIPFDWRECYGGTDAANEKEGDLWDLPALSASMGRDLSDWNLNRYKRNPQGKGYVMRLKDDHKGLALPRIEFTDECITPENLVNSDPMSWFERPSPACFGWVNRSWFPRLCFMGGKLFRQPMPSPSWKLPEYDAGLSYDDLFAQVTPVELAQHPRIFQGAHPYLQVPSLTGRQEIGLYGFQPDSQWLMCPIPTQAPCIKVQVPGAKRLLEKACSLSQIVIDADQKTLESTWHAVVRAPVPVVGDAVHDVRHQVDWN